MAAPLQERLESLTTKAQLLLERYLQLQKEHQAALEKIEELKTTLSKKDQEIGHLKVEIERLTVVNVLAPTGSDVAKTRTLLSELVQEIDKCISELSE
ncbi:MAG: hypothetical protein LIO90_02255 [Bacteroidales bacterium]|nr:hypothetical protein [Bacteroidales bacterium]